MANKFTDQRKKRNEANATEEFVEKLYEDEALVQEKAVLPKEEPVPVEPAKRGRPRLSEEEKELSATYSLILPESIKEKMKLAASARKLSVKKYIVMLVEEDYAKNAAKYDAYKELSEKIMF